MYGALVPCDLLLETSKKGKDWCTTVVFAGSLPTAVHTHVIASCHTP
jgi:hypothetical protein